jgi:hypothetical protein
MVIFPVKTSTTLNVVFWRIVLKAKVCPAAIGCELLERHQPPPVMAEHSDLRVTDLRVTPHILSAYDALSTNTSDRATGRSIRADQGRHATRARLRSGMRFALAASAKLGL